ncbi:hypothetical protein [Natrinema versiforme]|nr:hypothetical protein [Natrinema versiforme]
MSSQTQYKDERPCIVCGEPISASKQAEHLRVDCEGELEGEKA